MSSNTLTARVGSLETEVGQIRTDTQELLGMLRSSLGVEAVEAKAPKASKAKKGSRKGARKTAARKPAGTTIAGKTCLVRGNRKQFIADHAWATPGMSVVTLLQAVASGSPLTGNWAIGPKRAEQFGIKGKKAKGTKVVAEAAPTAPAKVRRANGTIAPKAEWDLRTRLANAGLEPKEIEAAVVVANA